MIMRLILFLAVLFLTPVYATTEQDAYSDPLKYIDEDAPYKVKIIYRDGAVLIIKTNNFREVIRASSYYYQDFMRVYYKPNVKNVKYKLLINDFGSE